MMAYKKNLSEIRFEALLNQKGFNYWEEDKIYKILSISPEEYNRMKKPDYYVETPYCDFFAEIKEFQSETDLGKNFNLSTEEHDSGLKISFGIGAFSTKQLLKPYKEHIRNAARKFDQYKRYKKPCILVFDNCNNVTIDNNIYILIQNWGNLQYKMPIAVSKSGIVKTDNEGWMQSNNGVFREDHYNHISAIAFNEDVHLNSKRILRLRIIHNPYSNIALPKEIFNGQYDIQFRLQDNTWQKII